MVQRMLRSVLDHNCDMCLTDRPSLPAKISIRYVYQSLFVVLNELLTFRLWWKVSNSLYHFDSLPYFSYFRTRCSRLTLPAHLFIYIYKYTYTCLYFLCWNGMLYIMHIGDWKVIVRISVRDKSFFVWSLGSWFKCMYMHINMNLYILTAWYLV